MESTEMSLADYVRYHERLGKKVVWLDGVPFSEYRKGFLWSLPRFREYDIASSRVRRLLGRGALGAIAMTTEQTERQAAFCICTGADYDFPRLQSRTRTRTRRGLEACEIREVGWDEMLAAGLEINRAALQRQQRPSFLGDAAWWRRQCEISAEFAGVRAWGAYVDGRLAAYVHVIVHAAAADGRPVADIVHFMSDNDHLKSFPNEALIFTVTGELLRSGCDHVMLGAGSDDERLLSWKRHMGFEIRNTSYHLVVNPVMHLVKPFVPKLRIWMDGSLLGAPVAAAGTPAASER
jgi:hypothetical protein